MSQALFLESSGHHGEDDRFYDAWRDDNVVRQKREIDIPKV